MKLLLTTLPILISGQVYGALERVVKWFKLLLFVLVGVLMILVKAGGK